MLEENLGILVLREELQQSVLYNLGNGYMAMYNLNKLENPYYGFMNKSTELNKAMQCYNKSLESKIKSKVITVQTYVNIANILDLIGRSIEAIEFYDKALSINPNCGMGIANKGIAITYYSRLMNDKSFVYTMKGYNLIKEGIEKGVDKYSKEIFLKHIKEIEGKFNITTYEGQCDGELEHVCEYLNEKKLIFINSSVLKMAYI